jgi:transcriptional regulator with XRE-family HTH domain
MAQGSYSAMLLARVRDAMKRRGMNRAALAKRLGVDRRELRAVLAEREPLTVDQFFAMVEALELSPVELGLPADLAGLAQAQAADAEEAARAEEVEEAAQPEEVAHAPVLALAVEDGAPEPVLVDPDGPQAAEILRLGFALGIDMTFGCATEEVRSSGVPEVVLARFPELLPIRLDAAYHHANRAQYQDEGLVLRLSFDRVRTCLFPWSAIRHITLFPEPPLESEDVEAPQPDPEPSGGPALRLVKS